MNVIQVNGERGITHDYQRKNYKGFERTQYDSGGVCKAGRYFDQYHKRMEKEKDQSYCRKDNGYL